ncbi:MAG: 1,4-dihydroxy-2-naphthoate octaprenyltransferase [Desulfobacterales bacterium]
MKDRPEQIKKRILDSPTPSFFKKWSVAIRPFALPASTMPVIFGTLMSVTIGGTSFDLLLFLAALFGMAILHTGSNLLNDAFDYEKGIDKQVNPVSGAVVRGWISPRDALHAGYLFLGLGMLIGLFLVSRVGVSILWIGMAGVAIGIFYTWGPLPLKFNALGDLAVFLNFGVLGALGAWTVQTGTLSWAPVTWAVPMSLLVVGILHSNNWRDIDSDRAGGIQTMASRLGDTFSEGYFVFLLVCPFVVIMALILLSMAADLDPKMPPTFLVTFLAIPLAFKLIKKGRMRRQPKHPLDFISLDGQTAQLNLLFGLLCTAALVLNSLMSFFLG